MVHKINGAKWHAINKKKSKASDIEDVGNYSDAENNILKVSGDQIIPYDLGAIEIDSSQVTDFDTAVENNEYVQTIGSYSHSHTNKSLLDSYTQTNVNLADAVSKKHTQNTDSHTNQYSYTVNKDFAATSSGYQQANLHLGSTFSTLQALQNHATFLNCGVYYHNGIWEMVNASGMVLGIYPTYLSLYKMTGSVGGSGSVSQLFNIDNSGNLAFSGYATLNNANFLKWKNYAGTATDFIRLHSDNVFYMGNGGYTTSIHGSQINFTGSMYANNHITLPNSYCYRGKNASGSAVDMLWMSSDNTTVVGSPSYVTDVYSSGSTSFIIAGANPVDIAANGAYGIGFHPMSDNAYDLGYGAKRWDDVYATNGTIQTSDGTQKEDITNLDLGLDFINELRPVSYKWKDYEYIEERKVYLPEEVDGNGNVIQEAHTEKVEEVKTKTHKRKHSGIISQELEEVLNKKGIDSNNFAGFIKSPLEDGSCIYGWRPTEFIAPLIKAVQELSAQNNDQYTVIEAQNKKIEDLESRLEKLEGLLNVM